MLQDHHLQKLDKNLSNFEIAQVTEELCFHSHPLGENKHVKNVFTFYACVLRFLSFKIFYK